MYAISERYKEVIYSGDSDNRLKLLFNGVEYDTANIKSEKLTVTSRILSNGNDRFSLDNFVSKEAELIIHDIDLEDIVEPISISIGTLVDGEYEYVPIGIFKLNETPTTDSGKMTIKLRDYSVNFDVPYSAEEIIAENGGEVTILQVLQDICTKCNVELGTTEFLNMNSKISVWDNSINARVYIMYIAEKAGCIATIDRLGRLILVDLQEGEAIEKLSEDNTIYINDALPRKLLDLELNGDTQQDGTPTPDSPIEIENVTGRQGINVCGKNLLPFINQDFTLKNVRYYVQNGNLYLDGTSTGETGSNSQQFKDNFNFYLDAGTYTLSAKYLDPGRPFYIRKYSDDSQIVVVNTKTRPKETFTLNERTQVYLGFYMYHATFSEYNTELMIEKGNTQTTYEPYKGNTYEVNLGKNLFNSFNTNTTRITTDTDGTMNISNVSTANGYCETGRKLKELCPNLKVGDVVYIYIDTDFYESGTLKKRIYASEVWSDGATKTITQTMLNSTVVVYGGYETTSHVKVMITKSLDNNYSPYFTPIELNKIGNYQDSIKKSTGKNLFDKDNANVLNLYIDNGIIKESSYNRLIYIPCEPNTTYTLQKKSSPNSRQIAYTTELPAVNVSTYGLIDIPANGTTGTITTGSDAKYLVCRLYQSAQDTNTTLQQMLDSVMINKGSTAIPLEPYGVGKWYKYCTTGKITFNGSENWSTVTSCDNESTKLFMSDAIPQMKKQNALNNSTLKCNRFNIYNCYASSNTNEGSCYHTNLRIQVRILKSRLSTQDASGFKNWLSNNNITYYYQLETPTCEEITNEELINQLESIELLKGLNNISITSEDLASPLKITYQQEKQPIELNPLLFEKYTEGDLLKISRVVYEDAIRKFEYGDETDATLYINSANPYVINEEEIHNVYNNIKDFEMYSMNISKMIGNPAIDPWDMLQFTYNDKTYKFLGQNTLTFTKNIMQTFDTQIGTNEKAQENVTLNAEPSQFKRLFTRMDQAEGNIELNASQISTVQTDLRDNHYSKEQTEQLILNAESGITNTFSEAGGNNVFRNTGLWFTQTDGNNPFEFWNGNVLKYKEENASNMSALLLQNNTLYQEQLVPNGNYTISFKYKKLITLATVKCKINDTEYILDSLEDEEFIQSIEVSSQHINVQFISDTNNSCEIYDLMVNAGTVKLAYSQNQNETTTDTVNISKGITITSSDVETTFKANADGVRIYDSKDLTNPKTKFTDKGMETDYLKVKEEAEVVDILIQRVGSHTWLTKI